MTALTDIIARPLLPVEALIALAILALGLTVLAVVRRLKGAWLRLGAALALSLALLDPALVSEDREPLSDIVLAVVDESPSQGIEGRADQTAAALAAIEDQLAAIAARSAADPATAGVELEIVRVSGDGARGTELAKALSDAVAELPPARYASSILITDGAVSDEPAVLEALQATAAADAEGPRGAAAPVHVLLTGREDEFDRRLVVEFAPAYGLVGDRVALRFRVEESGRPPADLGAPFVRAFVDGEPKAAGVSPVGRPTTVTIELDHPGQTVVELRLDTAEGELTDRNNLAALTVNAVRDRLEVLLVSGEPHAGERTWRNLLKSDASVDLVHFTILRPPGKPNRVSVADLALIPFPTRQLFEEEIEDFDLIIFDRYRNWRGILRDDYIQNIVDYVRGGGAVLVSSGPAFAGFESMYRSPLGQILPAAPTTDVLERPFRPKVTDLGARHPVTRALPGSGVIPGAPAEDAAPSWGRWFRLIDVAQISGDVLMRGAEERPLLLLDRVGEGRVALLASDHAWLWARGYDGGGPQSELLRRLAHWLMREPELEEEALTATPSPGGFEVERRSLAQGDKSVEITSPDGAVSVLALERAGEGLWRGEAQSEALGVHRITDAPDSAISFEDGPREPLTAIAVVGPPAPREFANPVSTFERLGPLAEVSGGGAVRLAAAGGVVDLRRIDMDDTAAGSDWIGLPERGAYDVRGVALGGLAPSWIYFLLAAGFALAAWRVEGR